MERVAFLIEKSSERIECLLNPQSVTITRRAGLRSRRSLNGVLNGRGLADDPLLYTGGGRTELKLNLLFDVSLNGLSINTKDVRDLTGPLLQLAENSQEDERYGRPPNVRFIWGRKWNIPGIVATAAERLEEFSEGGQPSRSWLSIRFFRCTDEDRKNTSQTSYSLSSSSTTPNLISGASTSLGFSESRKDVFESNKSHVPVDQIQLHELKGGTRDKMLSRDDDTGGQIVTSSYRLSDYVDPEASEEAERGQPGFSEKGSPGGEGPSGTGTGTGGGSASGGQGPSGTGTGTGGEGVSGSTGSSGTGTGTGGGSVSGGTGPSGTGTGPGGEGVSGGTGPSGTGTGTGGEGVSGGTGPSGTGTGPGGEGVSGSTGPSGTGTGPGGEGVSGSTGPSGTGTGTGGGSVSGGTGTDAPKGSSQGQSIIHDLISRGAPDSDNDTEGQANFGERLDQVAYQYYKDPAGWRLLSYFNDIDKPLHLRVGDILEVPMLSAIRKTR